MFKRRNVQNWLESIRYFKKSRHQRKPYPPSKNDNTATKKILLHTYTSLWLQIISNITILQTNKNLYDAYYNNKTLQCNFLKQSEMINKNLNNLFIVKEYTSKCMYLLNEATT